MSDLQAILISDFTIDNFAGYLGNDPSFPKIQVHNAPFGQVVQSIVNHKLECWNKQLDVAVVWTQPRAVIDGFSRALQFESVDLNAMLDEVDAYCAALR